MPVNKIGHTLLIWQLLTLRTHLGPFDSLSRNSLELQAYSSDLIDSANTQVFHLRQEANHGTEERDIRQRSGLIGVISNTDKQSYSCQDRIAESSPSILSECSEAHLTCNHLPYKGGSVFRNVSRQPNHGTSRGHIQSF